MKEIGHSQIPGMPADSNGFTIIEILSVLVIIGIISAVAVSKMASTGAYNVVVEAENLKNHLRYSQSRAMSNNESWGISITGSSYTLQKNGSTAPVSLPAEDSATYSLKDGVSITSGDQVITFDDLGSCGNSSFFITLSRQGNDARTVTVTRKTGFIH